MKKTLAAIAFLLLLAACGSSDMSVEGTITVFGTDDSMERTPCYGSGGFSDMRDGATVVVSSSTGERVAVGSLGAGEPDGYKTCKFAFAVEEVPAGEGPYTVTVGSRDGFTFKESDADSLELTLGSQQDQLDDLMD